VVKTNRSRQAWLLLAGFGLALAALSVVPAARASEGWAYQMAGELMSPFCPGRSVADCPSPQAQTLRMWLIVQESAGRSRADVEAELVSRYGETILGAPRARGFGLTAYTIPVAVAAAGALLLGWFLRRQTRARQLPSAQPVSAAIDPELGAMTSSRVPRRRSPR
jgi:cytochrome c-type biogenesis protein CcmH/NrfF